MKYDQATMHDLGVFAVVMLAESVHRSSTSPDGGHG